MPTFNIHTNVKLTPEKEADFVKKCSALACKVTGKPESYVMVIYNHSTMMFAGSTDPCAYIYLASLGSFKNGADNKKAAKTICDMLKQELGVNGDRVYIEFASPDFDKFGWNGSTFG
eukprot:CAMPEP_0184692422 /NCGR_PEP_ID=MMETSP0313-20130426/908_1 /TAXON_ID=2792 /ORGANISM="Porphyridium aerugineum, Strain SAG 1380-2" /LENGTH=116 /DNA_ID=CAMNT_0027150249 /DNA_START=69 /DNA_END=419 /DNA_ORIENTATION=+